MCMCNTPTVNGDHGYSWNGEKPHTRPPMPPMLDEGDEMLFDGPGRCGGLDAHCHHFRIVRENGVRLVLLVRNGSGEHRLELPHSFGLSGSIDALDSDGLFWLLMSMDEVASKVRRDATEKTDRKWIQAAAEKRIKTRKRRGTDFVKVWIEEPQ